MSTKGKHGGIASAPPSSRKRDDYSESKESSARLPRALSSPGTLSSRDKNHYIPYIGNFSVTGIPGYGGFIPGKTSENIIGTTFQRSNELSLQACDFRATKPYEMPVQAYNPDGVSAHRRGFDMVGYTGFVPGKYAQNVFGHVFTRTNAIASILKAEQFDEKKNWIDDLRARGPPLPSGTGVVGYTGYNGALARSQNLHKLGTKYPGVNSRIDKTGFVRPGFRQEPLPDPLKSNPS